MHFSESERTVLVAPAPARRGAAFESARTEARLTLQTRKNRKRGTWEKKTCSFAARKWGRKRENDIEKWRNSGEVEARGDRRVADCDFARFPSTYGRRSPDRCPPSPLPSPLSPFSTSQKPSPSFFLFPLLPPSLPSSAASPATALM